MLYKSFSLAQMFCFCVISFCIVIKYIGCPLQEMYKDTFNCVDNIDIQDVDITYFIDIYGL